MIGFAVTVEQVDVISEGLETVGKSFGDEQGAMIVRRKLFGMPVKERWRTLSQIDCYVPYFSLETTDQLHLGMWRSLVMHAAHGAASGGMGVVDLGDGGSPAGWCEFLGTEEPRQEASGIAQRLALDELETGQGQVDDVKTAHALAS